MAGASQEKATRNCANSPSTYYNEVPEFPSLVETDTCSFFELKAVSIGKLATLKVIKLGENSFKLYTANI